jgi:7,8-dihydropterin-6-yl-methyl-4-(beta-D-ribofuranosyl)aminobenzene 5'-phosphate synthase
MRMTALCDNNTIIDAYYLGEPAVSYYLEDGDKKILFDTGYSDVYVRNAEAMQIDLTRVDAIVLSHGHNDHTGGLAWFPATSRKIPVIAHPDALLPKRCDGLDIGAPGDLGQFTLQLSKKPVALSEHLTFLGEIPRSNDFENREPVGECLRGGRWEADWCRDDTALVYRGEDGLWIITGCSHAGICNITEYAKTVCGEERIAGILGGFHLMGECDCQTEKTAQYIKKIQPRRLIPCHCTCFRAKAALDRIIPVEEMGSGLRLEC